MSKAASRSWQLCVAITTAVVLVLTTIAFAPDNASSMTDSTLSVTARGVAGTETVTVKNGLATVGLLTFGTTDSTQSIAVPGGAEWENLELQFNDAPGLDLIVSGFALDGDARSMSVGDVLVSGQWTGTGCSELGPPIGETIHCFGVMQFPPDDGDPPSPPNSDLDPSYFGNAETVVPVYDTAWDMGVQVTLAQAAEYMDFLVDTGFSGFATTYLGNVHAPAQPPGGNNYVHKDPLGNSIAVWDEATGNLIMDPGHADHFEDILDLAHARGLRVMLLVVWERKTVEQYGLLNEGNAYNWGQQIGARFWDHPAIQAWTLGGDAGTDEPRTQFWTNVTNGLTDAGVTGDMNFHTGSSTARRVNQIDAPWNTGQLIMTSHCVDTALATSRLQNVLAQSSIPVWVGEPRYEGIVPSWCSDNPYVPTAQDIVDDALSFVNAGAAGLFYGHNERWQWGHGLEGSDGGGWSAVQQSFDAPGAPALIGALTYEPPPPDPIVITTPVAGAVDVVLPAMVSGVIQNPETVTFANVTVTNDDGSYLESFDKEIGFAIAADGSWSLSAPSGEGVSSRNFFVQVYVDYDDGTVENESSSFTVVIPDVIDPVGDVAVPGSGDVVDVGLVDVSGVASDAESGVVVVGVRVQRRGVTPYRYWNGSDWQLDSVFVPAVLDSDGSWQLSGVDVSVAGLYRVTLRIDDAAGNRAQPWELDGVNFTAAEPVVDLEAPLVTPIFPVAGATQAPSAEATVSGESTDDLSGVVRVRVRVRRDSQGVFEYWDGSVWSTSSGRWATAVLEESGVWSVAGVDLSLPGAYRVQVMGDDAAGNVSRAWENPSIGFTVGESDITDPEGAVLSPAGGSTIVASSAVEIAGSATDSDSNVAVVGVRIQRRGLVPFEYWNGDDWQEQSIFLIADAPGDGTWSLDGVDLSDPGTYRATVRVTDSAGNVSQPWENDGSSFFVEQPLN